MPELVPLVLCSVFINKEWEAILARVVYVEILGCGMYTPHLINPRHLENRSGYHEMFTHNFGGRYGGVPRERRHPPTARTAKKVHLILIGRPLKRSSSV